MSGLTLDTGALIALERKQHSMVQVYTTAQRAGVRITVPAVVVAEWWRAGAGKRFRERLMASVVAEDLTRRLAELAGEALGSVVGSRPDKGTIDGIVVTSAWLRGDTIYTSDVPDLEAIRSSVRAFENVAIKRA
jgi:predicted nucleic acid-binding protein